MVDRVKHLTTQLHWRLNEGKGTAFYEVGVCDNGDPEGIPEELMVNSVCTLARCVSPCISLLWLPILSFLIMTFIYLFIFV